MGLKIPSCFTCLDQGYVICHQDGYQIFTHCTCHKGKQYRYDGNKCTKPTPYYVASVSKYFDPTELAQQNFTKWHDKHKDQPGVDKQLKAHWARIAVQREGGEHEEVS